MLILVELALSCLANHLPSANYINAVYSIVIDKTSRFDKGTQREEMKPPARVKLLGNGYQLSVEDGAPVQIAPVELA